MNYTIYNSKRNTYSNINIHIQVHDDYNTPA